MTTRIISLLLVVVVVFFTSCTTSNKITLKDHPGYSSSTQAEALAFLDKITSLETSLYWPAVKPTQFLKNLKQNIQEPLKIYAGIGTNFCGYGAVTYLFLQDDPVGYCKLLLQLYREGKASFGKVNFTPSGAVKKAAGTLRFKGALDIHPAEQLWFLCLADHFKGYLNIFNRTYDPGDEDRFWASVNFSKFNRMVKQLLHYKIHASGSDLFRPYFTDISSYISEKLKTGVVVLYLNNRILHKKKLEKIRVAVPTHFVVLQQLEKKDDMITMVYWDYGSKTLRQLSPYYLRKIIFGVSYCTKKTGQ